MRHRAISILLLLSMVIYGGGIARALHHATAHGCDHEHAVPCDIAHLFASVNTRDTGSSCCGHGAHDQRDHHHADASSDSSCESSDDQPADHDHDCDTCDMLLKIAAFADGIAPHAFAATIHSSVALNAPPLLLRRPALCSGGPRAPPSHIS